MSTRLRSTRAQRKGQPAAEAGAVRIAGVQMASGPRVESNLREAAWLIEMAAEPANAPGIDARRVTAGVVLLDDHDFDASQCQVKRR